MTALTDQEAWTAPRGHRRPELQVKRLAVLLTTALTLTLLGCDPNRSTPTQGKNPNTKQVLVDHTLGNGFIQKREHGTWRSKGPLRRFATDINTNCRYTIRHDKAAPTQRNHIKGPFIVVIDTDDYWFSMHDCKALYLDHR